MRLDKLIELLDIKERLNLYELLKKEFATKPNMLVDDFIESTCVPIRLCNLLRANFKGYLISNIKKEEFLRCRNAGKKTWDEFVELRGF